MGIIARRIPRRFAAVLAVVAASAYAGSASSSSAAVIPDADSPPDAAEPITGGPIGSQSNPLTAVGQTLTLRTHVVIFWPEGTTEDVLATGAPTRALAEEVLAEREAAEHRGPNGARRTMSGVRHRFYAWGATACSIGGGITKVNFSTVGNTVSGACTGDVTEFYGELWLYRSSAFTVIGSDWEDYSAPDAAWDASGPCLPSTWQYNSTLQWGISSAITGTHTVATDWGPTYITC